MHRLGAFVYIVGIVATLGMIACSGGSHASAVSGALPPLSADLTGSKIRHVVILVQENRSFDNLFATYPGADGTKTGLAARPSASPTTVPLVKTGLVGRDIPHDHHAFVVEYDGGAMDGFNRIYYTSGGGEAGLYPYQYVAPKYIQPYWTLAKQYVLADHLFQTQSSGSFTAHQDLIAGGTAINATHSIIDYPSEMPWNCGAPPGTVTSLIDTSKTVLRQQGPFPCFKYRTLRDLLDAKSVSWKYYLPKPIGGTQGALMNAFGTISAVYNGPEDKTNIIIPETTIFSDITAGKLPAVSWVIPDGVNSDHLGTTSDSGPSWVAQVVNAIGKSKYWNSAAIVVVWDDWGGLYDHVPPPQLDYQGLGFRVPMLIVSPYVPAGKISHTQYEFGSILKFVENNWSLGRLDTTDVRANSIGNVFDFTHPPRSFTPIKAKYSLQFLLHQPPSNQPVDNE